MAVAATVAPAPTFAVPPAAESRDAETLAANIAAKDVAIERAKRLPNVHPIPPICTRGPLREIITTTGASSRITLAPGLDAKPICPGSAGRMARESRIYKPGFAKGRLIVARGTMLGAANPRGQG
jgi:hypothetical protein